LKSSDHGRRKEAELVRKSLGTTFVNFGREYPSQTFGGFVPADSGITADQITKLQGKIIGIVGTIEIHKGKPEIKIMSMYQIVDLSSKVAE
jgi:hypothetical protein